MSDNQQRIDLSEGHTVDGKYVIRQRLGSGGAGVVYKVEQLGLGIHRALKFLDPIRPGLEKEFEETFKNEVKHLALLTHGNIVKIVDYSPLKKDGLAYPYFVMEYANGGELAGAIRKVVSRDELLKLLDQLFHAIEYIHNRGIMHGDIKPSNLLCHDPEGSSEIEIKIGDLGVSKLLRMVQIGETTSDNMTYVWGTRNYAAPEIREFTNSRKQVEDKWLNDHMATLDQYSLGTTLAELLSDRVLSSEANRERIDDLLAHLKPNISACLTAAEQLYLKRLITKLTERDPELRYKNIQAGRAALQRITPQRMAFGSLPELTRIGCTRNIHHGNWQVALSEKTFRWINHPAVQRLNNLSQLNLLHNVYPGAHHTRFSHSLDAFETAREVALHLIDDDAFRFLLDENDLSHFLAASLLHDVGQYPLAHALEELRPNYLPDNPLDLSVVRADYELFTYFLQKSFEGASSQSNKPLWNILQDDGISPERLARLVSKFPDVTDAESVMQTLLDGAFDIDKIAYLRHDSQATFVPFGNGIDTEGLFDALVVLLPSQYPQVKKAQIGLLSRGISAAESIITARYHMFNRVYWHRTNRAIMAMLNYAMRYLVDGDTPIVTFAQYIGQTWNMSDREAVYWLSKEFQNALDQQAIKSKSGRPVRNFLSGIVNGTRLFHKRLVTFINHAADADLGNCQEFLLRLNVNDIEHIRIDLQGLIAKYAGYDDIGDEEVLLDVPQRRKELQALPAELWVVDEQTDRLHPFGNYSRIAEATRDQYKSLAHRSRIFVSPRLAEACAPNLTEIRKSIADHILQHARHN